jgi:hypothetical protein
MRRRSVRRALCAAALAALPTAAFAQFPPPPPPPGQPAPAAPPPSSIQQRWPEAPQTQAQPRPAAQPPAATPTPKAKAAADAKPKPKAPATPSYAVICSGVFAKDTNHLKLAVKYDSRNIAYTDVDGPDQSRIKATVLFPRDPKRRLEVLWDNDAARSGVQVISINGQSHWTAPKGLKLGLSIEALQRLNQRAFRLSGFGPDGNASVLDWQGGALAALPGGCKVGIRLAAERGNIGGDRERLSNDAALKSVKANVAEILVGY